MNGIALYDATMSDGKMNHFCSPIRISCHFNYSHMSAMVLLSVVAVLIWTWTRLHFSDLGLIQYMNTLCHTKVSPFAVKKPPQQSSATPGATGAVLAAVLLH
jgi:hypothetical protein